MLITRRDFLWMSALVMGGLLSERASALPSPSRASRSLIIGVGRDFFDGPDSRSFLHGSTNTWEALTYLDKNLRAEPWLAESWKASDGSRTWSFIIRRDVFFHDGSPLTIDEIMSSLRRMKENPKYDPTGIYKNVESLTAKGNRELIFHLKEPSPAFPNLMAYYSSPIIKPSVFNAKGHITQLVATGPFQVDHIKRGEQIALKTFPLYWGPKPFFERITFRTITDAQSRLMALLSGAVQAVADVGGILPEQTLQCVKDPQIVLKGREVATTHYLFFNCHRPPFDHKEGRLWLAGLVDRKVWVKALTYEFSRQAQGFYSPLAEDWRFPPAPLPQGRKPLPIRRVLTLLISNATIHRWPYLELVQLIQERLAREGFPARIQVLETGPYQEALKKLDFDLVMQPNTLMTGDPDFFYSYYLYSKGKNNFGFVDAEADQLIQEARKEPNLKRRRELYFRLDRKVSSELPVLPLYHDIAAYAHRKALGRFEMDQNFRPDLIRAGTGEGI
jgi:peptide/nickel transport system substrate-binding protein